MHITVMLTERGVPSAGTEAAARRVTLLEPLLNGEWGQFARAMVRGKVLTFV